MYSSYIDRGQKAIERCGREKKESTVVCTLQRLEMPPFSYKNYITEH